MAEFCLQCAKELDFDPDWKGMLSLLEASRGLSLGPMLCETCGPVFIDHEGRCLGCDIHPFVSQEDLIKSALQGQTYPKRAVFYYKPPALSQYLALAGLILFLSLIGSIFGYSLLPYLMEYFSENP